MIATSTLIRWPDAAGLLGISSRKVLDLIVAGELEPVRRPDDLYVRRDQVEAHSARRVATLRLHRWLRGEI